MPRRSAMFKTCCGDCGECWYVGNPRTCTCPDETTKRTWVGLTNGEMIELSEMKLGSWDLILEVEDKLKDKNMKSEQIKHSLSVGVKSIQSRVFDRETDEVISFVKIPIADSGLVRCEKGTREMNNKPVAWIDPKELDMDVSTSVTKNKQFESDIPLYVQPQKYCPSENNEAYEKGFIEGMAKQRDSKVQQMVEGYTHPVKDLEDIDINITWNENSMRDFGKDELNFARAILRKAQEK